jgi:hypothetical protein
VGVGIDYSGIVRPLCSLCGAFPRVGRRSKKAPGTIIFETKCKRCYADNTVVERPYDEMARDFGAQLEMLLAVCAPIRPRISARRPSAGGSTPTCATARQGISNDRR